VALRDDTPGTWSGETLTESVDVDDATLLAAPVQPGRDRLRGKRVGRYVLDEPIGHGGMGVVYRARDPQLDRELAIKVVLPQASDLRAQDRLLGEARAMAKLRHPSVVPVFDVGATEHGVYVVMPLVGGGTLRDWLARPRPWREVATRFLAAGRGLAAAHAVGLVHRDFKPHNVLVDEHGAVAVADFGLASEAAPAPADGSPRQGVSSIAGTCRIY
jgi:serine/threonine protein kinase